MKLGCPRLFKFFCHQYHVEWKDLLRPDYTCNGGWLYQKREDVGLEYLLEGCLQRLLPMCLPCRLGCIYTVISEKWETRNQWWYILAFLLEPEGKCIGNCLGAKSKLSVVVQNESNWRRLQWHQVTSRIHGNCPEIGGKVTQARTKQGWCSSFCQRNNHQEYGWWKR